MENAKMADGENRLSGNLRYKLYVNRFLEAWADRSWKAAVGLYLFYFSQESLSLQAINGIVASLAVVLILPSIGRWVHRTERLLTARIVLFLQNFSICMSAIAVSAYLIYMLNVVDDENPRRAKMMFFVCAAGMISFASSAQVWYHGYSVILEHDWMVAMAGNSKELTGPKEIREPRHRMALSHSDEKMVDEVSQLGAILEYFKTFTLPGISYALVYLTVLGMDTITTGFLLHQGVTADKIGLVSTFCGLTGVIATIIYPPMVRSLGLSWSAFIGYAMQALCSCLCVFDVESTSLNDTTILGMSVANFLFICGIVLSRTGLWIADLAANQLVQYTPKPAIVSGMQRSLNTFAELIKFILVIYFPGFDVFYILVFISIGTVTLASILSLIFALTHRI
ncbi:Solute carrier family 40 member 1 [Halotydeus destructor]|nr:Solute carrier family 40 member 1 [Halotydeus destructor]